MDYFAFLKLKTKIPKERKIRKNIQIITSDEILIQKAERDKF